MDITITHTTSVKFVNEDIFCGLTLETFQEFNSKRSDKLNEFFLLGKTNSTVPSKDSETGAHITHWISEEDANNWLSFVTGVANSYNVSLEIGIVKPL